MMTVIGETLEDTPHPKLMAIEIRLAANGYMTHSPYESGRDHLGATTGFGDWFIFPTLEALLDFLSRYLETPSHEPSGDPIQSEAETGE